MATRRFFLAGVLALALLIAFGTVGVASAQTTIREYVQSNAFADASWCEAGESGEICYEASLEVFNPDKSGSVGACLTVVGSGPNGESVEVGCADVAATFSLDPKDLSTASLAPTAFDLYLNVCDPDTKECDSVYNRTVTLAVEWSAVGRVQQITDRLSDAQNNCVTHTKIKGDIQAATTTVTIDGVSHEGTGELQVLDVQDRIFCS
jgi:hypothetical protein